MGRYILLSFLILLLFASTGCYKTEEVKLQIDSIKLANKEIERNIKDLEVNITREQNRINNERETRNRIERERRIENLKNTIDGSYSVGNYTCSISGTKITWSNGRNYNDIYYIGDTYGNKLYNEFSKTGTKIGEFLFYQDYSKGTYYNSTNYQTFTVTKNLY
jgi:hypothetical protein